MWALVHGGRWRGGGASGGAIAALAGLAMMAQEGPTSRAERAGGLRASRRTRCTWWQQRGMAETRRPCERCEAAMAVELWRAHGCDRKEKKAC